MEWNPYQTGSQSESLKVPNKGPNVRRKNSRTSFRHSRERTSTGQAQALWTFLVAIAVAIAALVQLGQQSTALAIDSRTPAAMSKKN